MSPRVTKIIHQKSSKSIFALICQLKVMFKYLQFCFSHHFKHVMAVAYKRLIRLQSERYLMFIITLLLFFYQIHVISITLKSHCQRHNFVTNYYNESSSQDMKAKNRWLIVASYESINSWWWWTIDPLLLFFAFIEVAKKDLLEIISYNSIFRSIQRCNESVVDVIMKLNSIHASKVNK